MIKFKNINGDVFLAVGSVKRKSALNGEKSLSATITKGDDVLNKIDKGWSLEFDNEPYVVTYFERNDNDNTVEIDAIHKFFWDMTKSVLYATYSSSHVARFYLDEIFKDTGYTYALNFDPKAFEKENWGMKNKLSLFNDIISSIGAEFEINGTLISIFKNVGSDLSTIVRHGFNLSDMTLENDNANFATYAEGFGAYEDQENQKGPRLHVTYKSSLAKAFGKLHAEPVDDQRYTVKDNLLQAVKDKVDGSFAVSVKLSLYDLTAAGYPYKMANVGDWLLAVDENLDFKQRIRIISVDDEFAEDGTRISYTVTCGDVGVAKKYQDTNASLSQKVQSAYDNAQAAKESAIQAVISSTGKNTNYWFDSVDEMNAFQGNEGDLAFVQIGDGQAMYVYTKMPDGSFKWVKRLDPDTGEQIAAGVEEAISTANKYTDELNEKQAQDVADFKELVDTSLADAQKDRDELSQKADDMLTTANKYSDDIYSKAVANAKEQANSTLTSANQALADAKTTLGKDISKAQADITATQNELSGKVSQSDFDTTTGDLTTKYGQIKATADSVTTDVANYKKSNDSKVSANTANITANAKAIDLKVSQTDFDATTKDVNTKIANQKITVDKISDSVTELQAKANAQGQVNQLFNTEFTPDMQGWDMSETWAGTLKPYRQYIFQGSNMLTFDTRNQTDKKYSSIKQTIPFATSGRNRVVSVSWWSRIEQGTDLYGSTHIRSYDASMTKLTDVAKNWNSSSSMTLQKFENISIPDEARFVEVTFAIREGYLAFLTKPMFVYQSTVGDYVQGNYNNNARVTALELDINGIHGLVNDPSKGLSATWDLANNGQTVAVQAQKDATTAITTAKGLQTTVNDNKNDLQAQITATAKQVATEMTDRANGDKSVRTDMANLIDQRVSSLTTGYETAISQSADKLMASVSMPNKLLNTEFTPDLQGWSGNNSISYVAVNKSTKKMGSNVLNITHSADTGWGQYSQKISNFMVGGSVSASVYAREDSGEWTFTLDSYDATGKRTILRSVSVSTGYSLLKIENVEIPQDAVELRYSFWSQTVGMLLIAQPMLVFSDSVPIYMPGSYSGINTSTVLELFKDNWALGIADNSGKIISGINGDTSGTVIQGKKLVINSDTTINGKAFIDGSVIKDASIGTAQIGKAAIGSAQIINVDVSKISGNIANFITGNINTLNSSVLYGNTGHLTTVDTGLIINNQDDHLQLSSKGQYDVPTKRAQFELLGYADNIDSNMQGSLNYYKNPHNAGTGLGIRFYGNQILAIDESVSTGNLYLSPYASGQVQVVNRDRNGFQDIKASKFVTSSERKYKSEINEFNDDALDLVNGLNIRSYIKNSENEIGVIADEADERILDKTNTGVDLYSFVSVVAKAVQELSAQVKELQSERPNN